MECAKHDRCAERNLAVIAPRDAVIPPPVPDLSDMPAEPARPPGYSEWSLSSMRRYLEGLDRRDAWHHAATAARRQAEGAPHRDVMQALAAAEQAAPDAEKPWHARRLDAYAAAYGLRGWYRYKNHRREPRVQVNKLRTPQDGERGRYYVFQPFPHSRPRVVDRDDGQFVGGEFADSKTAREWITAVEGG
jgi:hypothetical protein